MTIEKNKVETRQAAPRKTNKTALFGGIGLVVVGFAALLIYFLAVT